MSATMSYIPTHVPTDTPMHTPTDAMSHAMSDAVPPAWSAAPERPKFWSEADCKDVLRRAARAAQGGGVTAISVWSTWTGHVRWARNLVSTAGEQRNNVVAVQRNINGAMSDLVVVNDTSDAGLEATVRHAERAALRLPELAPIGEAMRRRPLEVAAATRYFSDATYQLDAERRAEAARRLAQVTAEKGLLSAGYVAVSAHALAYLDTLDHVRYAPYTQAQYSVTVRNPKGTASGWAGDSHWDWAKLQPEQLTQVALEKCVQSADPVRVEPGRYTAVLEPQAVADFVGALVYLPNGQNNLYRFFNESTPPGSFEKSPPMGNRPGFSKLGERVVDARLTLSTDPTAPALGYPPFRLNPFSWGGDPYLMQVFHPVTWIKDGVLTNLAYDRDYAIGALGRADGLPNPGGFRLDVTGPTATVDEMVASTKRGLLVTRFHEVEWMDHASTLCRGYTRDGLWLIEDGKLTKPVKNFQFTETVLGKLNSVEQLGVPTRVFHPMGRGINAFPQPVIVPALKLNDFSFTALSDAV